MRSNIRQYMTLIGRHYDLPEPVIEIGSLRTPGQEHVADVRPLVRAASYTGWDMRSGEGVEGLASVHHLPLRDASVGTVIMLETLEHVLDPLAAMREVSRVVRAGGATIITSPMGFPIHAYPSDYWRFTPMAFDYLLSPFATRRVFMQGNSLQPVSVLGVGLKSTDPLETAALHDALERLVTDWDPSTYGPLVESEPLSMDAGEQSGDRDLPVLVAGRTYEQSFTCRGDGLRRVDVQMASLVRFSMSHLRFELFAASQPDVPIVTHRIAGGHVIDGEWMALQIPLQEASAGRTFILRIDSPDGMEGNAVAARASNSASNTMPLLVDGQPFAGTLCFQAYCRSAPQFDAQVIEDTRPDAGAPAAVERASTPSVAQTHELLRALSAQINSRLDVMAEQIRVDRNELKRLREETERALTARRTLPFEQQVKDVLRRKPRD